jgi:hypothetical protein
MVVGRRNIPSEVQCPVLVAVASRGVVAGAVDLAVRNRHASGGDLAED